MPPVQVNPKLLVWGRDDIEDSTIEQASKTASLPFVPRHVALMPDAHFGIGSTVGSVIPTKGAIIPAAIGVDIGCGMAAIELGRDPRMPLTAEDLPDDLDAFMPLVEAAIPAGKGRGHNEWRANVNVRDAMGGWTEVIERRHLEKKAISQCGSLGGGNHFFEICLDERNHVWVVLHSGSRGIGSDLARIHIDGARKLMQRYFIDLPDPNLAYFVEGTDEFKAYIGDMLWAQRYARLNRDLMLDAALAAFGTFMADRGIEIFEAQRINCHHNFTQRESHGGDNFWITRKGAIKAGPDDLGIIPGSMGTRSFIVRGLGNPASYNSCSHGAGRKMSRTAARKAFTADDLAEAMAGKVWNADKADELVDEIPGSYKDIDAVMAAQADLVEVLHELHQILNFKGTA